MYTPPSGRRAFRRGLLGWYGTHGRDLPWRRTAAPYRILVSEVMLQQTQAARVIPAYRRFLRRFPTLRSLARAALGDVLVEWSGLGYPRRARDLRRAAIVAGGRLPQDAAGLDALPGIGAYTAGAVACFAFGAPVAFADTNIRRVLGRAVLGRIATEREAVAIDAELLPQGDAARWHHALMDLGATVCVARSPRCGACPLFDRCRAQGPGPVVRRRRATPFAASDRRVRGAILRVLVRDGPTSVSAIVTAVGDPRAGRLVRDLATEGLLEVRGGRAALPGSL